MFKFLFVSLYVMSGQSFQIKVRCHRCRALIVNEVPLHCTIKYQITTAQLFPAINYFIGIVKPASAEMDVFFTLLR